MLFMFKINFPIKANHPQSNVTLITFLYVRSEIPDLFPDDEVENIVGGLRNEVKNAGMTDTRDNCWRFFIERVRKQLKVSSTE